MYWVYKNFSVCVICALELPGPQIFWEFVVYVFIRGPFVHIGGYGFSLFFVLFKVFFIYV